MQEMNVAMSSHPFIIYFYILLPALHLAWGIKPEIGAFPSKVVKKGDNVTIRCSSPYYRGRFRLQRTQTDYSDSKVTDVYVYDFTVTDVQEDNSTYSCIQYSDSWWSERSDLLSLQVIDPQKSIISCVQGNSEDTQITCSAPDPPKGCRVKRFHLYSGSELIRDLLVKKSSPQVTFKVSNPSGAYKCSYLVQVVEKEEPKQLIEAPISDELTATECNEKEEKKVTDDEEEEETKVANDDGKANKRIDYNDFLIPVVAASCGILMLILIVILVVYFTRNKSSTQKMKNGDFHHSEKAETTPEATYCTVDENRMRTTPDPSRVLKNIGVLEASGKVEVDMSDITLEDYDDGGITYATLNKTSLNKKSPQSDAPAPTDTSLYAEVKKSRPK